jgi:Rrf2 family protein
MGVMQVSRKVDYALRAAIYLATQDLKKTYSSTGEIAEIQRIPKKFLEKIIQDLVRSGLVKSKRGPDGGYSLARPSHEISFQDIIEAVEDPIALNACVDSKENCDLLSRCTMSGVWQEVQRKVDDVFARTTLADVKMSPCHACLPFSSFSSAA